MATSESTRARRFALPQLEDLRTEESIEAFVHGRGSKSAALVAAKREPQTGDAVALRSMPGRLEWHAAIERESARSARYERPTAVAILELRPVRESVVMDSWLRLHAAPLGQVLLRSSRATDVVARVTEARFQVLLPETTEEAAGDFIERVVEVCDEHLRELGAPLQVAASIAAASADVPLRDALTEAIRSLEAA